MPETLGVNIFFYFSKYFFYLSFDTSNYSDWPGNFISRDESSANCNVREIEINGKPQYCYYATKHISKGARFSFFPVSESERMNPVV